MWNWEITLFSHFLHIILILFSHFGARDPGLGPKAAARGPGRAWPAAALGPGPGFRAPKCENNMKIIWKTCENDVFCQVHIIFTFFHIIFIFLWHVWPRDPDPRPKSHIFCNIPGDVFFILFSYFCENLVFQPLHTDNLYKYFLWLLLAWCAQYACLRRFADLRKKYVPGILENASSRFCLWLLLSAWCAQCACLRHFAKIRKSNALKVWGMYLVYFVDLCYC